MEPTALMKMCCISGTMSNVTSTPAVMALAPNRMASSRRISSSPAIR
jgi:hypothetical protein